MAEFLDLSGHSFGKLTAIRRYTAAPTKRVKWVCTCECGNERIVDSCNLTSGHITSCGCSRRKINAGDRFGHLVVESYVSCDGKHTLWRCRCDCGRYTVTRTDALKSGATTSCGCVNESIRRAFSENQKANAITDDERRIHGIWHHMMGRCYNPKEAGYEHYGGMGVSVCERWHDMYAFTSDLLGEYVSHVARHGVRQTSLDRIDPTGNYNPSNVRWATTKVQANNQRRHQRTFTGTNLRTGQTFVGRSQSQFARQHGIKGNHISAVLSGRRRSACGFTFKWSEVGR